MSEENKKCPFCGEEMRLIDREQTIPTLDELEKRYTDMYNHVSYDIRDYKVNVFKCGGCKYIAFFSVR